MYVNSAGERRTRHEEKRGICFCDSRFAVCFAVRLPDRQRARRRAWRRNAGAWERTGYQHGKGSEYPVYELDRVIESKVPQKEKAISLTFAIHQKQDLILSIVLADDSEVKKIAAGGEPPADGKYVTLKDGTMVVWERYQNELWKSGEGLSLIMKMNCPDMRSGFWILKNRWHLP